MPEVGKASIVVREAQPDDAAALSAILNEIIAVGGTTAYQTPLSEADFCENFLTGEMCICCHVATDERGELLGFQALEHRSKLPDDWGDIATFARITGKVPGVGSALFARTLQVAESKGLTALNATIRADNTGGLAFYEKIGFRTYEVAEKVPLHDGTPVDRISKRYVLS